MVWFLFQILPQSHFHVNVVRAEKQNNLFKRSYIDRVQTSFKLGQIVHAPTAKNNTNFPFTEILENS